MTRLEKNFGGRIYGTWRKTESKRQKREKFKRALGSPFWQCNETKPMSYFISSLNRLGQIAWYNLRHPFLVSHIYLQVTFHSLGTIRIIHSFYLPMFTQGYLERKWMQLSFLLASTHLRYNGPSRHDASVRRPPPLAQGRILRLLCQDLVCWGG